jgi:hypothetical protein
MMYETPSTDTVERSYRAIRQFETDQRIRRSARLDLAKDGLLMVAPGQW